MDEKDKLNNNVKIFVISHKEFKCYDNKVYTPICNIPTYNGKEMINATKGNDTLKEKGNAYSELLSMYWLWKNYDLPQFVGTSHYRRYFNFLNNVPNINEIFKEHDIVYDYPTIFPCSLKTQYGLCHNISDLEDIETIIKNNYPNYFDSFEKHINGINFYGANMFIMKKEDYIKYCEILFNILFKFDELHNLKTESDYIDYVKFNKSYQYRLPGFLAERITSWYMESQFHNPKLIKVVKID